MENQMTILFTIHIFIKGGLDESSFYVIGLNGDRGFCLRDLPAAGRSL
jgi:hypothetical protein